MKNEIKNRKKLKILLLTDRVGIGGAETHILSLYRALSDLGHSVTVVSGGGELSEKMRHINIDLSRRSPIKLILGYFALLSLVKREKFDLIHAHARLPALIGSFVAKKTKIPLVTTVHARFKVDFLRRKLSSWGFRSVAVSEDLKLYLSEHYSVCSENITVIENGVDFSTYGKARASTLDCKIPFKLAFLSRLDCDCSLCAELLCDVAPRLFERYRDIQIVIGGGGECFEEIKSRVDGINSRLGKEVIRAVGYVSDAFAFFSDVDAFVGVSRCAIEAIASKIPVIIAGNEGFFGRLTSDNFSLALGTNFCARGEKKSDSTLLFESICTLIDSYSVAKSDAEKIFVEAQKALDILVIAPKYEEFYYGTLEDYAHFKERTVKNLLFGYYGFSNLGDDALLRVAVKRVRGEYGGSVGALTNNAKKCSRELAIPCYPRYSPFALLYRIFRCERLIFGGGTVFQDITSKRSFMYYLLVLRLALAFKKDVRLYASGVGEIGNGRLRRALFRSLERCSYIGVRDERSYNLLKRSLVNNSIVALEDDLAVNASASTRARAECLIYSAFEKLKNPRERLDSFFVVCPHFRASRFDCFELDIAIRKQKNKGYTPFFIACSPLDAYICRRLKAKYGGGVIFSRASVSFSDLLAIFPYSKFVVSMRYHPLLAARLCGVDVTVVGDDPKIDEFR